MVNTRWAHRLRSGDPIATVRVRCARAGMVVGAAAAALAMITACGSSAGKSASTSVGAQSSAAAPTSPAQSASSSLPASSAAPTSQVSKAATAAAAQIMIEKFKYTTPVSVSPGATVSVMNMDGENHTVTADAGNAFDAKANAGATTTFTAPMAAGSYPFHCTYHSNMHGVLVVK